MILRDRLQPVDWACVDKAIQTWIMNQLNLGPANVTKLKTDLDQPKYPYVKFLRTVVGGEDRLPEERHNFDASREHEEIEKVIRETLEFTVEVQTFTNINAGKADPNCDAMFMANRLRASLGLPSVCAGFSDIGVALVERMPALDISTLVNVKFDSRASLDIRFRIDSVMTERLGYFDKAEISRLDPEDQETVLDKFLVDAS